MIKSGVVDFFLIDLLQTVQLLLKTFLEMYIIRG